MLEDETNSDGSSENTQSLVIDHSIWIETNKLASIRLEGTKYSVPLYLDRLRTPQGYDYLAEWLEAILEFKKSNIQNGATYLYYLRFEDMPTKEKVLYFIEKTDTHSSFKRPIESITITKN